LDAAAAEVQSFEIEDPRLDAILSTLEPSLS
jgi:hypothetical protein